MERLYAIFDLFRKGSVVSSPELWKNGGIGVALLVPLLLAVARVAASFGLDLGLSEADAGAIAAGIVSITGIVTHLVSSDKVGFPAKVQAEPAPEQADLNDRLGGGG